MPTATADTTAMTPEDITPSITPSFKQGDVVRLSIPALYNPTTVLVPPTTDTIDISEGVVIGKLCSCSGRCEAFNF